MSIRIQLDPQQLGALVGGLEKIMAAIDDLKAGITRLTASVSAELKAIGDKLAGEPSDADIASAASAVNSLADQLDAETRVLTGNPPA